MRPSNLKYLLPALAALALSIGAPAQAQIKVGVLDFGRLLEESPQGKVLLESLGNEAAAKRRDLQGAATALQTKRDKLNKDRATMSPDQISRAEKELRDGERDLARRQAEAQDELNDRRNEETGKLQRDLLNEVDWAELGFVCDGRFLFAQRSLEHALKGATSAPLRSQLPHPTIDRCKRQPPLAYQPQAKMPSTDVEQQAVQQPGPAQPRRKPPSMRLPHLSHRRPPLAASGAPHYQGFHRIQRALKSHAHPIAREGWNHRRLVPQPQFVRPRPWLPAQQKLLHSRHRFDIHLRRFQSLR